MARLGFSDLQQLLRDGLATGSSVGTFIGIPGTISYELAALAGFDWVICDLEHGENEFSNVSAAVVGFSGPVITRVPSASAENVSRVLDRGSVGVMLPRISSKAELDLALLTLDCPPRGIRGVASYNRSGSWGHDKQALAEANPVAVVQAETKWAADNPDEIANNPRVDAVFVGPLDLSFSLDIPRDFENPIFVAALERILSACKAAKVAVGILAVDIEKAKTYRAMGFDFIAIGSDSTSLLGTFTNQLNQLKEKL
jgi:2-dehydro-3-deoxyglucarate aldolase/4-hydroxy-2-oxoheptanedioate aldolase